MALLAFLYLLTNTKTNTNKAKKIWFYFVIFSAMGKYYSTSWKEKEYRAKRTRKAKKNGALYSSDDRRERGLAALNAYIYKETRGKGLRSK